MKFEFSTQIFEKYSDIKFHENPTRGIRDILCGPKGGRADKHTDIPRYRHDEAVAFRNFSKTPKDIPIK